MCCLWPAAASEGEMLDWVSRSGSLKERRCFEPDLIADEAAAAQGPVNSSLRPQSMGTYSKELGTVPVGDWPQL